jgi:hypothetical protein
VAAPGLDAGPRLAGSAGPRWWQTLLWLALPFAFYLIPLLAGYAWNAHSPGTPEAPGSTYTGRDPDVSISVERYGTGVLFVPFQARLRQYLQIGELPLWNPYQGLGEPFAAQGDGNPYFPVEIVRALLAYSAGNYVTFLAYYISAVFLYLFLRGLGVSHFAAVFGGTTYALSGALSLHIARPNFADQLCMVPVVFWAAARALRSPSASTYCVFALSAGLHLLAGHIQIAMISAVVLAAFCVMYAGVLLSDVRAWARRCCKTLAVFALGNGLGAFYLLPQLEAARITFNKNNELLAFLPMSYANLTAFFFPVLFGHLFQSWLPLGLLQGVDWNNLYAYAGMGALVLSVVGWIVTRRAAAHRSVFLFFLAAGVFLLLRYVSFPLVAGVDVLPALGRQSPKHSQGLAVFCFVVAAAIAVDYVRAEEQVRLRRPMAIALAFAASAIATVIGAGHGLQALTASIVRVYFAPTLLMLIVLLGAIWLARRWDRLPPDGAKLLLVAVAAGELSVYLPIGNSDPDVLYARVGIFLAVVGSALLWALSRRGWSVSLLAGALAGYAAVIVLPSSGLPRQANLDAPPPFMIWLKTAAGDDYRAFGITPDYSSIGAIQDIGAVGPLAPPSFERFVSAVSPLKLAEFFRGSSTFELTNLPEAPFSLATDYPVAKPILDWFGVRYVVLDRGSFNPTGRTDDQVLLSADPSVRPVYEDSAVRILESSQAQSKALFSSAVQVYAGEDAIMAVLQANPAAIQGALMIEAGAAPALAQNPPQATTTFPVPVESYRPNAVRLSVDAPSAGILVLKDAYMPGWRAALNGSSASVIRVNAMARGVVLPGPGRYAVQFDYVPDSFVAGVWLSGAIAVLLLAVMLNLALATRRARLPLTHPPRRLGESEGLVPEPAAWR